MTVAFVICSFLIFLSVCICLFVLIYCLEQMKYGERVYRLEKLIPLIFYCFEHQSFEDADREWDSYIREYHSHNSSSRNE